MSPTSGAGDSQSSEVATQTAAASLPAEESLPSMLLPDVMRVPDPDLLKQLISIILDNNKQVSREVATAIAAGFATGAELEGELAVVAKSLQGIASVAPIDIESSDEEPLTAEPKRRRIVPLVKMWEQSAKRMLF